MSPFDFFKARAENLHLSQCLINVNRLAECCAAGGGLVSALSLCCWAWMFRTCVRSDLQTCYSRSKTLESGGSRLWLPVPNLSEPRWQVPSSGCGLLCASEYKAEAPFDPECKKKQNNNNKQTKDGWGWWMCLMTGIWFNLWHPDMALRITHLSLIVITYFSKTHVYFMYLCLFLMQKVFAFFIFVIYLHFMYS